MKAESALFSTFYSGWPADSFLSPSTSNSPPVSCPSTYSYCHVDYPFPCRHLLLFLLKSKSHLCFLSLGFVSPPLSPCGDFFPIDEKSPTRIPPLRLSFLPLKTSWLFKPIMSRFGFDTSPSFPLHSFFPCCPAFFRRFCFPCYQSLSNRSLLGCPSSQRPPPNQHELWISFCFVGFLVLVITSAPVSSLILFPSY